MSHPSTAVPARLWFAVWRQRTRTPQCPEMPRLDGKLALVTGGNAGIGLEIARGLAQRGAEVILAARNASAGERRATELTAALGVPVHFLPLDLSDLGKVLALCSALGQRWPGRPIDIFVQNAGVWPQRYQRSAQGHEIAYATNVLGHFALTARLLATGALAARARVVVVTGDIYIMARACSADFTYRGAAGGTLAYCRSKLGNLWFARELQRRQPQLEVAIAHPGVVASGLVDAGGAIGAWFKRAMLLNPAVGAQTPLLLATQNGIERGAYYHNTLGRMALRPADPALDAAGAERLWAAFEAELGHYSAAPEATG